MIEAVVEADEQVLAERFDRGDLSADDPTDLGHGAGAAGSCRGHAPPDEVRPKPGGRPEKRVAFGHADYLVTTGRSRRSASPR